MSQSLGELIRERRLGLGFSLGQLATEVSTSVNQVRRWERGEEIPTEAEQAVLAPFLGIEVAELAELVAAIPEPEPEPEPTDDVEGAVLAVDDGSESSESPTELFSAAAGVSLSSVAQPEQAAEAAELPDLPEVVEADPLPTAEPSFELPVEPVAVIAEPTPPAVTQGPRPVPLKYPESAPLGVAVEITEPAPNPWNPLRYLFDPEKPWLYWVRAGLTVIVLLILLNILFDSVGELFDKIGELFDTIEPTEGVEDPVEE